MASFCSAKERSDYTGSFTQRTQDEHLRATAMEKKYSVQSLEKGLVILNALSTSEEGFTLAELSSLVEFNKSTVHRILATLI
ncbi:MAG: helix-turn-helix domain-containing protein, partial [Chloroflexota bacterium]